MSIMSCVAETSEDGFEWHVKIEYADPDEVNNIYKKMETILKDQRRGLSFTSEGFCAKGPQGIWTKMDIEFETKEDQEKFMESWWEMKVL